MITLTPAPCEPLLTRVAQPPQHHRERREAEVRLGLAAARREEEQVHRLAIGIARSRRGREDSSRMKASWKARQLGVSMASRLRSARATARFATRKASSASASVGEHTDAVLDAGRQRRSPERSSSVAVSRRAP